MVWIGLGQQPFQPSGVEARPRRVCSLIEPVKQFIVEINDLVPVGGKLVPVRRWFTRHRSASVLWVPDRGEAFSLPRVARPTMPMACRGHHASLPVFCSLAFEIASFSRARSCGCDPDRAYGGVSFFPPLHRPRQGTPGNDEARSEAATEARILANAATGPLARPCKRHEGAR